MSRRHSAEKREVNPDPKFQDLVLTKGLRAAHDHLATTLIQLATTFD